MALSDIRGQDKAVAMLLGCISRKKTASSYLFSGEQGVGKKTAARNFAKALNCLRPQPLHEGRGGLDACDDCDSCRKIDAATHPDVLLVSPVERLIRIDEIRLVNEALSYKAYEGRLKVVILDDAETMNSAAANAFLKTLEEPPSESMIILVSSRPDLLLPTIRSRCSRINFGTLSPEACKEVISRHVAPETIELVCRLAMGRPGEAITMDLVEDRAWFLDLFKGMLRAEKDAWASREEIDRWFGHVLTLLRDVAVGKITGRASGLLNVDMADAVLSLGEEPTLEGIMELYHELSGLKRKLIFNLNKSITWNFTAALLRKELSPRHA